MKRLLNIIVAVFALSANLMAQPQQSIEALDQAWGQFIRNEDIKVSVLSWSHGMKECHFKYTTPDDGQPIRLAALEQLATVFNQNAVNSSAIYSYNYDGSEPPIGTITFMRKDNYFSTITGTYSIDDNDNFRIVNFMSDGQLTSFGLIWHELQFCDRNGKPFRTIDGRFFKFHDGIWTMKRFDYWGYQGSSSQQSISVSQNDQVHNDILINRIKAFGKFYVESKQKGDEQTCDAIVYALKKVCDGYNGCLTDQQFSELCDGIKATFLKDEDNQARVSIISNAMGTLADHAEGPIWGRFAVWVHMNDENIFVAPDNRRELKLDYNLWKDQPQVHVSLTGTASAQSATVTIRRIYPNQRAYSVDIVDGKFTYEGKFQQDQLIEIADQRGNKMIIMADSTATEVDLLQKTLRGSAQNERFADCQRRLSTLEPEFHKYATYIYNNGKPGWAVVDRKGYDQLVADARALQLQMMEENKDNLIPVWYLTQNFFMMTADELASFMQRDLPYADHVALQPVWLYYEGLQKRTPGRRFIDMAAVDTAGVTHRLSEYIGQGKYAILCFWDMGSRSDMKTLKDLQKNDNLNVVCITMDRDRELWADYVRKRDLNMIHLQPTDINKQTSYYGSWEYELFKAYGITTSLPETIIFDPDGRIVAHGLCGESLRAFVRSLQEE